MQVKSIILSVLIGLIAISALADKTSIRLGWNGNQYYTPKDGGQIGLALSGGGARGLAQIGVLKAFEEADLNIGGIAGTSIGGIIGGLYAAGYTASELDSIISDIDFNKLFSNKPARTSMFLTQREEMERYILSIRFDGFKPYIPQALTTGQQLSGLLSSLTLKANYISGGDFNKLRIPYRAVTTDIVSGEEKVLYQGNLADAMRATMAFPLAFTGVETGDMILMDGGMVDPIPVKVVRRLNPDLDLIVAVNTTSELLPRDKINNPVDIANQATSIMTMDKLAEALESADLVVTPDIEPYLGIDFENADSLIGLGYRAGKKVIPEIRQKLRATENSNVYSVRKVVFKNSAPEVNDELFSIKPGDIVTEDSLWAAARSFYQDAQLFFLKIDIIPDNNLGGNNDCILEVDAVRQLYFRNLDIIFSGNSVFSDSVIATCLTFTDDFISADDILRFSRRLVALYKSRGFDLANLKYMTYNPEDHKLNIEIDEAMIEAIKVSGNDRTKQWLIKSNFPLHVGHPFNSREAGKGINNIYSTDLFEKVTMNLMPGDSGAVVRISVIERKYTQARLGWHWDNEYHSEEFIELLDDNLFGTGQEFMIHAQYGNRRQKYDISLKADRFFSTYFTYKTRIFYSILDRNLYDEAGDVDSSFREDRAGFEFLLGHQISRLGTVSGGIKWEEIKTKYSPGGNSDRIKLRSFELRSLVETINRLPFPTRGKKHLFYFQYSADILGGETNFSKLYSSVESYFQLTDWLNFHPRVAIGLTDAEHGVPESEKFYIGGHYSFYGFQTDELVGGKMVLGNMEVRFNLPYRFYLSTRYDLGQVYSTVDQIKLKNIHHGFGISLAYDSPIGPFDFGYGKSGSHPDVFYIDIGLVF